MKLTDNFDKTRFAGEWYEVLRDSEFFYESGQECTTHEYRLQEDGSIDLYFRAESATWGGYSGVGGTLFDCGESENTTCLSSMGPKAYRKPDAELRPYNILWINEDHDLAVSYSCSERMWGLFSYQWFSVISKSRSPGTEAIQMAAGKVLEANVGYSEINGHVTDQGDSCEYDWTLA